MPGPSNSPCIGKTFHPAPRNNDFASRTSSIHHNSLSQEVGIQVKPFIEPRLRGEGEMSIPVAEEHFNVIQAEVPIGKLDPQPALFMHALSQFVWNRPQLRSVVPCWRVPTLGRSVVSSAKRAGGSCPRAKVALLRHVCSCRGQVIEATEATPSSGTCACRSDGRVADGLARP